MTIEECGEKLGFVNECQDPVEEEGWVQEAHHPVQGHALASLVLVVGALLRCVGLAAFADE